MRKSRAYTKETIEFYRLKIAISKRKHEQFEKEYRENIKILEESLNDTTQWNVDVETVQGLLERCKNLPECKNSRNSNATFYIVEGTTYFPWSINNKDMTYCFFADDRASLEPTEAERSALNALYMRWAIWGQKGRDRNPDKKIKEDHSIIKKKKM
jgi:hypothetical protein